MAAGLGNEGVLRKLLAQMNLHIPARRSWLSELLAMKEPMVVGRDGKEYAIHMEELELVRDILGRYRLWDVKLPILLLADSSMSQPVWRVEGREECIVVSHLIGRQPEERSDRMFLHTPHVAVVIRELPTAATCMYLA